ncbi:MAG: hypothetical protein U9N35_03310 [Euryarchaeota archaeon]|nr:hypothetical protein [Euryarchaeota archaeon]
MDWDTYKVNGEVKSIYGEMGNAFVLVSTKYRLYCFFRELKWEHPLKNCRIVGIGSYFTHTFILANMVVMSDEGLSVYERSGELLWNFPVKGICDMDDAGDEIVIGADRLYFFKDSNEFLTDYKNYENPPYKIYDIQSVSLDLNWNGRKLAVLTGDELIYYEEDEEQWRIPASGDKVSFCRHESAIALKDETGLKVYNLSGELIKEYKGQYFATQGNYLYKLSEGTIYSYSDDKAVWKSAVPNGKVFINEEGDNLLILKENKGYYLSQPKTFLPGYRKYWGIFLPFLILQFLIILRRRFSISIENREAKIGAVLGLIFALLNLNSTLLHGQAFVVSGCIGFLGGSIAARSKGELWGIPLAVGTCIIMGAVLSQILAFYHWIFYLIPSYPGTEALGYMVQGFGVGLGGGFFSAIIGIFLIRYFWQTT